MAHKEAVSRWQTEKASLIKQSAISDNSLAKFLSFSFSPL